MTAIPGRMAAAVGVKPVRGLPSAKPLPPRSAPKSPKARPSAEQLLASLDIALPQVNPPVAYGLAMGLLSAWLTLIPAAYLALLAFLSWLVVWHTLQALITFSQGPYFVFHVPMACLGALLLLFLIKPVFFRRKLKDPPIVTLSEQDEPLLFAFVGKLCALMGSAAPTLIEVDCEPNAAARFSGGLGSLFGGKLVLRIGLPLVVGLPVRQFAGVLAHEFGHFNQRSGMTGSYLIRRLASFFAQIVFQRDRLDEKLARLRRHQHPLVRGFYFVAVGLIEPARGVLWLMLVLSELLTCGVLRRMEYDADHAEANLAGVRDFIRTNKLVMFLQLAAQRARHDLAEAWEQQRLADDLPAMVVASARQLAEHRDDNFKVLEEQKTGWLDTHPCHNDRVGNVERMGAEGLVHCDASSKYLFRNFGDVCRRATLTFYRTVLAEKASTAKLVPTPELVQQRAEERKNHKALRRFFRNRISAMRPVLPGPDAFLPATNLKASAAELVTARQEMLAGAEAAGPLVEQLEKAVPALAVARAQLALCDVFTLMPKAARIWARANREMREQEPIKASAMRLLVPFEQSARKRLTLALRLLQSERVGRAVLADGSARQSSGRLIAACSELQPCLPAINRLQELSVDIRVLFSPYNPQQPYRPLVTRVLAATGEATALLRKLQADLALAPYPFEHAAEGITIGGMLVQRLPNAQDPPDVHACVSGVINRYYTLLFRALAQLTHWAESVETAIGLQVCPEPPERDVKISDTDKNQRNTRRYWLGYGGRALAGVTLLVALVWLSINPPTFSVPWGTKAPAGYKPNGFHMTLREYPPSTGIISYGPTTPDMTTSFGPNRPFTPLGPHVVPSTPHGPNGPWVPNRTVPNSPNNNPYQPNNSPYQPSNSPHIPAQHNAPQSPNSPGGAPAMPNHQQPMRLPPPYVPPPPPQYHPPAPFHPQIPPTPFGPPGGGFGGHR